MFPFRQEIDQADFYTYEARFMPDDAKDDALSQNNEATAFTHVQGKGQVLLIENWEKPGEFDHFVERLRTKDWKWSCSRAIGCSPRCRSCSVTTR